jgi:hypothetical protein
VATASVLLAVLAVLAVLPVLPVLPEVPAALATTTTGDVAKKVRANRAVSSLGELVSVSRETGDDGARVRAVGGWLLGRTVAPGVWAVRLA